MTGSLKAVRAAVVLVVFVVAVAVLVAVGTRSTPTTPSSAQTTSTTAASAAGSTTTTAAAGGAASSTTTSTTSRHGHGATTTTTTPHASVSVVVANATNTNGLAAHFSNVIGAGGWKMGTPIDASTTEATSTVYYAAGQQAAAQSIANTIGVKPAQVQPLTTAAPVAGVTGTDVVVVIGQDLATAAGS
jgi:hypothetical protein